MKKLIKTFSIITVLLITLLVMTGCENKEENENINFSTNQEASEGNEIDTEEQENTTNEPEVKEEKVAKEIDKTPVDINDRSSYFFVVKGKEYKAGDKIADLTSDGEYTLNKTGAEKEIPARGYLIGGGAVRNKESKTVFNITPYNSSAEQIKGADGSIGGFSLDKYGYDYLNGEVEICRGITIGTSIDDIKAVFGEPTKTTEATETSGPIYTYDATDSYTNFTFGFDTEGKVKSIKWQKFIF